MVILGRVAFALLFAGAGAYLLSVAARFVRRRAEWKRDGVLVEGTVVALQERKATSGSTAVRPTYAPVVANHAADGSAQRLTSSESQRPAAYEVGQKVMVRCLNAEAEIDAVTQRLWPLLVVLLLATVCLAVSVLPFALN